MKRLIQTLKNIWSIEDLRKRILYTIGLVLIYRIGSYVVLPGVDPSQLAVLRKQGSEGLMGLLNMFSGGAFSNASIFALGIMPYITASIVIQLLVMVVPKFQKMQREGESGRRKMNQITRWLTVAVTAAQAPAYITNMRMQLEATPYALHPFTGAEPSAFFWISSIVILISGTLFVMWLGERITDKGVGNGISLLIMIGIIARLPFALSAEFASRLEEGGGLVMFLFELVVLLAVILLVILLVQGTRRIPVQYAKRQVGRKMYGGQSSTLPMKVNMAGVLPIIFAQTIAMLPATIGAFATPKEGSFWAAVLNAVDTKSILYMVLYFLMIIMFSYFYSTIQFNPIEISNNLKKNGGFIPGFRPGKPTTDFIKKVLNKVTLFGAIYLGIVAILPLIIGKAAAIPALSMGGTSVIIVVGVALETVQSLESQMLMRQYKGFLE